MAILSQIGSGSKKTGTTTTKKTTTIAPVSGARSTSSTYGTTQASTTGTKTNTSSGINVTAKNGTNKTISIPKTTTVVTPTAKVNVATNTTTKTAEPTASYTNSLNQSKQNIANGVASAQKTFNNLNNNSDVTHAVSLGSASFDGKGNVTVTPRENNETDDDDKGNNGTGGTGSNYSNSTSDSSATTDNASGEDNSYGQYLADYYQKLIDTINKQKEEQEKLYEAKYKQLVQQANDNYNSAVNSITKNNAYTNRWLKQNYGGLSGQGLSNSLRANTNYNNNLYSAQQDLNSALLNAETDKYNNQAEATNTYLNNYNNYVTSPISNVLSSMSKTAVDDGSYKKYINKLFGA